jgi:hypothetical protein
VARTKILTAVVFPLSALIALSSAQAQEQLNTWSGSIFKSVNPEQSPPPVTFSFVSATWTQPSVVCTVPDAEVSIWVGLDGDPTSTVEQAGTVAVCGTAAAPLYYKAFWEMYAGANSIGGKPFIVSPGDFIQASVTYTNGDYVLSVADLTSGQSYSTTRTCDASVVCNRATAEWIVERPGGGKYPLADFGTVKFANIGVKASSGDVTGAEIDMVEKSTDATLSTCENVPNFPFKPLTLTPQIIIALPVVCTWVAAGQ